MSFMQRLIIVIGGWHDQTPTPYTTFVDEQSERLFELVLINAKQAVEKSRRAKLRQQLRESDIIDALIDKLQEAGF